MPRFRLRPERLRVLAVAALLLLATGVYYVIQRGKLGDVELASDKTLLTFLATVLLLLAVGLATVMMRNLARVVAARRRGVIGSRLQARVAFAFLFLVLIPSLTLFGGAIAFVSGTLKALVPPEVVEYVERRQALAEGGYADEKDEVLQGVARFAEQIRATGLGDVAGLRRELGLFAVGVTIDDLTTLDWDRDAVAGSELRESELRSFAARLAGEGGGTLVDQGLAYGWIVAAVERVDVEGETAVVWAASYLPESLVRQREEAMRAATEVRGFGARRPTLQRFYVVMFALLTMLVLFAAVWTGLYLARQITDPILELSRATRALTRGELSHRVSETAKDEIGFLARSFNRMAAEIQRQRHALTRRRRYIETLLETVPVGVISMSTDGRVSTANREALRVLAVDRLHPGRPVAELLEKGGSEILDAIAPVLAGRSVRVHSEAVVRRGDAMRSVELNVERFSISEGEEAVLVVVDDLTQLRKAERLAAWGEVAKRVAHEIKNPLTPIRLAAERMLRKMEKDPEGAVEAVEEGSATIVREVVSIKSMLDEFSQFARLPEVDPRPGEINDVVREAVALFREAGHEGRVSIEERLTRSLPPHLVDLDAMRRCVINLLDNSVEAVSGTGRSGSIVIATRANDSRGTVVLEVADDGPGIREADRGSLFLPSFSRRPGGTGLGLAIVHRIVSDHGGVIRAEDAPGGGTRVVIELPVAPSGARSVAGPERGPVEGDVE